MLGQPSHSKAVLVGVVLLAAGLAGCAGDSGESTASFGSYEEAKQAPGTTWQATNTDSPIELRLLAPSDTTVETGETDIVFLLYDSQTDEPITNAEFEPQDRYQEKCGSAHSFCAEMPDMGHGASPEESPEHVNHGVYKGMTTFTMDGEWMVNINPMVDGEVLEYDVDLTAQGSGGGNHG